MNYRKQSICTSLIVLWSESNCQSLLPAKEHYEAIEISAVGGDDDDANSFMYLPYSNSDVDVESNQASNLGDGMSRILESYLRMYETTKDKAYLLKFVLHTIRIQEIRGTGLVFSVFCQNTSKLTYDSITNFL